MFVYFNDDVFVQSTLHPSDLFTSSRDAKLFVDDFTIPLNKTVQRYVIDKVQNSVYWSAMFKTVQILEDTYGADGFRPLQVLEHAPFVFDKGVIQQMHHLWAHEFQAAHINKFRRDNDILFAVSFFLVSTSHLSTTNVDNPFLVRILWISYPPGFKMLRSKTRKF